MRRSISCALAGLLTVLPVWVIFFAAETDWTPGHKGLLTTALILVFCVGAMWLYDEVHNY